ncbi:NAD-dependent epimerase/dehydratase family protein [Moraxella sp.]|uniref:NAD-dependent epimerase/dehydratase family protein n=1 Tax=Moraxella sp. TaxID=479 RepID=UPI00261CB906|nr:NAD-dependent epimerase/dehydratase family protein [Moraxella sp.]MCP3896525.1 NAD-dependent epimerase/dehydratase family protein [Moraxella sp.]
MPNQFLIIGQGAIGYALANQLAKQGESVITMSRTAKSYLCGNVNHLQMDARRIDRVVDDVNQVTHIAIIVAPDRGASDRLNAYHESYFQICQAVADIADRLPSIQQVLFVSSTSVYGENAGEWIDEHSPAKPALPTAQVLYDAEQMIKNAYGDKSVIVRPSGIYGKSRRRMIELAKKAHVDGVPSAHYTNRIMDVDLVAVLARIMICDAPKSMYLVTDLLPVSSLDVMMFICQVLDVAPPAVIDAPTTGKRILSNVPRDWLTFPDYKAGYAWILED